MLRDTATLATGFDIELWLRRASDRETQINLV
jgi:hypothetical protein